MGSNLHRNVGPLSDAQKFHRIKMCSWSKISSRTCLAGAALLHARIAFLKYHTNVHRINQKYLYMICYEAYTLFLFQGQSEA